MKLLTTRQVSIILSERLDKNGKPEGHMSVREVQNEIKKGHLSAQRLGQRQYFINERDLLRYVRRKPGNPKKIK